MPVEHLAILEIDSDQRVDGNEAGEEEVSRGHARRSPEGHDESQLHRMPAPEERPGGVKRIGRLRDTPQVVEDLAQSRDVEGVEMEEAVDEEPPAAPEQDA